MGDFVLVDLYAQADDFDLFVRGWKVVDILEYMQQYGIVTYVENPDSYLFRSRIGIATGFRFTEKGWLVIIGDHTTYVPRQETT